MWEYKKVVLLADYGSLELANKVYCHLEKRDIPGGMHEFSQSDLCISRFKNGEIDVVVDRNVRGRDVFVLKSCNIFNGSVGKGEKPESLEYDPNNSYMELFLINDAIKKAAASSIIDVMPYMPYQRQDRRPKRQLSDQGSGRKIVRGPISSRLFADFAAVSGAKGIVTLDPHFKQIEGFYGLVLDCLESNILFAEYLEKTYGSRLEDLIIVAPDHGAAERAAELAGIFNLPIAICDKRRLKPGVADLKAIISDTELEGKICAIFDDLVDSGGTLILAADALRARGASEVIACCTHPVLSLGAKDKLLDAGLKLVTTNSIAIPDIGKYPNIIVLDLSKILAEAIYCICAGKSLSSLLFDYKRYKKEISKD
ncbi:MAG: ribose-phosphate diphosphokinase [Candidatus Woesearchaeota archaeon]